MSENSAFPPESRSDLNRCNEVFAASRLSMMRIIARRTNATTVLAERSKSRAKRRLRLIHAKVRSTIQRLGASKPAAAALRRHQNGAARLRVSGIWISPAEIEDVLAGIRSISETAAVLGESKIGLADCRCGFPAAFRANFFMSIV
jgi:hypothetical protein